MKLGFQKQHLMGMLSEDYFSFEDKSAIKFALNCIQLAAQKTGAIQRRGVPYWRHVEYTDDGCSIYQCLDCKEKWEARTPPGYMEYEKLDGQLGPNDEPIYHPVFKYCPYCSVEFEGPIRRDSGNERMLGDKRLARTRIVEEHFKLAEPTWWWVIQVRSVWPGKEHPSLWLDENKLDPFRYSAVQAYSELKDRRERCCEDDVHHVGFDNTKHEARLITRTEKEMSEIYPIAWQELNEIR